MENARNLSRRESRVDLPDSRKIPSTASFRGRVHFDPVRYKNWKLYFAMVSDDPAGFINGVMPYSWTQVVNIKRDPFETSVGQQIKSLLGMGGALAGPVTAYIYDWNLLPIGQALWLKELETYHEFPPMQDPASYNLDQVVQQVKASNAASPAGQ